MSWKLKLLAILNVLGWVVVVPLLTAALLNPFVEFKDWPGDFLLDHPASEARLPQEPAPNASPKPAVRDHGRSAAPAAAALVVPHLLVPVPVGNQIVKVPVAGPAPRTGGGGGATPVPGTPQRQPASNQPPGVVSPPPVQPPASGPPSEIPQAPPATPVEVPIRPGTATAVDETPAGDDSPPAKGHGAKKPKKPKGDNGRHLGQLKPHARAVPATPAVPGHPTIPAVPATPASAVKRPAKVRKARQAPAPAPAPRPRKPKKQVVVPTGVKPKQIHVAPDDDSPAPVGPPPGPPGPPPGAPGNGNGNGHAYGHFK